MSGSYYILNSKYNSLAGILGGLPVSADGLTRDLDANGFNITDVNNLDVATINGLPPPFGKENLEETLTYGNDAGGLDIQNLNQLGLSGSSTITDSTGDLVIQPPVASTLQLGSNVYVDTATNRVGINVPAPTEDLELDGNFQMNTGGTSKIVFYDAPNAHEHSRINAAGEGTNGGVFQVFTKQDGGAVGKRLSVNNRGAIGIGDPVDYGTAGYVLSSQGSGALPTWTNTIANATNATNAVNADNVATASTSTNATHYIAFKTATSGDLPDKTDGGLTYNPSTNVLTTTTFSGSLSGNATTATDATNADNVATASTSTNATHYVSFKTATSGNLPDKTDGGLTYNPSTNVLTMKILERGVNASFSQSIANGGAGANITFTLPTNIGGSTYISTAGSTSINPVQKGYYSISVVGTASTTLQGSAFGIIIDGGLSLYNSGYLEQGSEKFIGSTWYISLNFVRYFAAGDTFNIRCNNWGTGSATISGTLVMRLIQEIP